MGLGLESAEYIIEKSLLSPSITSTISQSDGFLKPFLAMTSLKHSLNLLLSNPARKKKRS